MKFPSSPLLSPAVFGAMDGVTCVIGVIFPDHADPMVVLKTAVGVGIAEVAGMAAGEFFSDSENGLAASLVIGASTGIAAIAPAIPYGFMSGLPAAVASAIIVAIILGFITLSRISSRGWKRSITETAIIFGIVVAAVVASVVVTK